MEREPKKTTNYPSESYKEAGIKILPNGRVIFPGESFHRSEPIKGTRKKRRSTNKNNRRR